MDKEGIENLSIAVIKKAAEDYAKLCNAKVLDIEAIQTIERFFLDSIFSVFISNPRGFIQILRREKVTNEKRLPKVLSS